MSYKNNIFVATLFIFFVITFVSSVLLSVCFSDKKLCKNICLDEHKKFTIIDRLVTFGFRKHEGSGDREIDTVIIHSSYNSLDQDKYDVEKIIAIYKSYDVAPHYIIGRDGRVYRLVKDCDVARHAGTGLMSKMPDGRTDVNVFSIGIELVANKTDGYTKEQEVALDLLIEKLSNSYTIKYILGHCEVAPERKDDPWRLMRDGVLICQNYIS